MHLSIFFLGENEVIARELNSLLTDRPKSAKTSKKRTHSVASLFSVTDKVQERPPRQTPILTEQRPSTLIGDVGMF
jgi:hypothetical protein